MKHSSFRAAFIAAVCLSLLLIVSCATVGKDFPTDPVTLIKMGETTKTDIRRMFGEPWRTGIENGQKTWTFGYYKYRLFGETVTRDLVVRFDDRDRVASYTFSTSDIID